MALKDTKVHQSRTCPANQDSTDESDNKTTPWEYDNPERNKADGCMTKGASNGELALLWDEGRGDCDLADYKIWRDVSSKSSINRRSIPETSRADTVNRKTQVLPEGKVFVFGSSSHPCKPGETCNAVGGDWRNTQPWDDGAGCVWWKWSNGNTSNWR